MNQKHRRAGEVHRQIRQNVRETFLDNLNDFTPPALIDIVHFIETRIRNEKCNWAFPTGVSMNKIAAHFTPNNDKSDTKLILTTKDIIKIDFGVHCDGYIVDAAFSFSADIDLAPLITATREATTEVIKITRPGTNLGDIGRLAEEIISSYEVTRNGTTKKVRPIRNLCGHSIERYCIHAGQSIPNCFIETSEKISADTTYAIETFASLGRGFVEESGACSHYRKIHSGTGVHLARPTRNFLDKLEIYQGLPFCRRWVDSDITPIHLKMLKELEQKNLVEAYPPLADTDLTSQHERTIYVTEKNTTVL